MEEKIGRNIGRLKWASNPFFILILSWLSLYVLGLVDNSRGPLYPLILEDLKIDHFKGAFFFSVGSFVAILGSFSCRYLFKYLSVHRVFQFSLFVFVCLGVSLFKTTNYVGLIMSAVLFGIAFGLLSVSQNVMASTKQTHMSTVKSFSILHSMYALAALTSPLLASVALKNGASWNFIFLIICMSALPVLILSLFARKQNQGIGEKNIILKQSEVQVTAKLSDYPQWKLWSFVFGCYVSAELLVSTRLVVFLESLGWGLEKAQFGLALFFLGLLLGRIAMIFIKNISHHRIVSLSFVLGAFCMILALSFAPVLVILSGLFLAPVFPMGMTIIAEETAYIKNLFSQVSAQVITLASVTVVIMHLLVGKITDVYGIQKAFILVEVLLLFSAFGMWRLRKSSYESIE